MDNTQNFKTQTEQFADIKILRYQVPGFDKLPLRQKELLYYLYEAALSGRDMIYDQNFKHNIFIRRTLENIYKTYPGDRGCDNWNKFMVYLKRVWFSNGIHHHNSMDKFLPDFSKAYFNILVQDSDFSGFPGDCKNRHDLIGKIKPLVFDKNIASKRLVQDEGVDMIEASANNFYENISQKQVEKFYSSISGASDNKAVSHGLNSKLVVEAGEVTEKVWKLDGMYHSAIKKIIGWLEKATPATENQSQKAALQKLIEYYSRPSVLLPQRLAE